MIERIRAGLWYIRMRLIGTGRREKPRERPALSPAGLRGNVRSVIVVKPEDPMFSEAVFILDENYIRRRDEPARELMRQAREAAERCTGSYLPPKKRKGAKLLRALAVLGFGAALVLICLYMK